MTANPAHPLRARAYAAALATLALAAACLAFTPSPPPEAGSKPAPQPSQSATPILTADEHAIYVISQRTVDDQPKAAIDAATPPTDAAAPLASRLLLLNQMPLAATAADGRLVLILTPNAPGMPYPVRELRTRRITQGPVMPGRLKPRPPIPANLTPHAITQHPRGTALLATDHHTATRALYLLHAGQWRQIEFDSDPSLTPNHTLLAVAGTLTAIDPKQGHAVITTPAITTQDPPGLDNTDTNTDTQAPDDDSPHYTINATDTHTITFEPLPNTTAIQLAGQVLLLTPASDSTTHRRTLIAGRLTPPSTITLDASAIPLGMGQSLAAVSLDPNQPTGPVGPPLATITTYARDGSTTASGTLAPFGLLDVPDLALLLTIMLGATLSMALIIAHVIAAPKLTPPRPGLPHATPSRRMLAATIDLLIGLTAISPIYRLPVTWWTGSLQEITQNAGVLPILTALGVTAAISALGESTIGTTPGKRLLGITTIDNKGNTPTPARAIARSIAKTVCPAAILWVIIRPEEPHPAAFNTYVTRTNRSSDSHAPHTDEHNPDTPGNEDDTGSSANP